MPPPPSTAFCSGLATKIATRKRQRKQAEDYTLPDAWVGTVTPSKRAKVVATTELSGEQLASGLPLSLEPARSYEVQVCPR